LASENADLRAALFGLKQELTDLYMQLEETRDANRVDALVQLLASMNAPSNRRLLDNVARSNLVIKELLQTGWQPDQPEVEGVVYSLKLLMDYLLSIGVKPIHAIGSQRMIRMSDLREVGYVGSEFRNNDEVKLVEYRSPGWEYQGRTITSPEAFEIGATTQSLGGR
jgi:hypothetical protein